MSYTSFGYLFLFLPLVWVLWAVLPRRGRPAVLLAASLLFYWISSGRYLIWMLAAAGVTWLTGLLLGRLDTLSATTRPELSPAGRKTFKKQLTGAKRLAVGGGAAVLLGVFLWLKYWPFAARSIAALLDRMPGALSLTVPSYVLPLGISFVTLMAVGYLVDVYRGSCRPAAHYWQVLSFLCFWPHVVEGPFDRWDSLSGPLLDPPRPSYKNLTFGVQRVVWGLFKKMVIADRANMYVKAVFDDYTQYSGLAVVVGTLLYTLQLYAEFSGCMDIVLGSAECFGIPLAENFRQPFFSRTVGEFWRRWHITLGAWLREYLFQPLILSGPWKSLGKFCRTRLGAAAGRSLPVWAALGVTWVAIGWWHGAGWLYLVYGLYYFFWQLLGEIFEPIFTARIPRLAELRSRRWYRLFQVLRTCLLVLGGMLIFRANGTKAAIAMFRSLAVPYAGSLLIQLDARDLAVLAVGAVLLLAVDLLHEKGVAIRQRLAAAPLVLRWAVYIAGVLAILIFGAYGDNYDPAGFIYAQF